jgi:hypothetical protein
MENLSARARKVLQTECAQLQRLRTKHWRNISVASAATQQESKMANLLVWVGLATWTSTNARHHLAKIQLPAVIQRRRVKKSLQTHLNAHAGPASQMEPALTRPHRTTNFITVKAALLG